MEGSTVITPPCVKSATFARGARLLGAVLIAYPLATPAMSSDVPGAGWMAALRPHDQRLTTLGYRLAVAAAPFCSRRRPMLGFEPVDRSQFDRRDQSRAIHTYRLGETPGVLAVAADSPADRAGLRADDALRTIAARPVTSARARRDPLAPVLTQLAAAAASGTVRLTVERNGAIVPIAYHPIDGCAVRFVIGPSDTLDAAVAGDIVQVNLGLMTSLDDAALAGVIAHELAHIALSTDEGTARDPARAQRQELEADLRSVAILRAAGYGVDGIVGFWRRMAAGEGGRFRTRRHLPPLERAAAIEAEAARLAAAQTPE